MTFHHSSRSLAPAFAILALVLIPALTGCATLVNGGKQKVTLSSTPSGVPFEILDGDKEVVMAGTTPYQARLKRGDGYFSSAAYTVCFGEGENAVTREIGTSTNGWWLVGNLFVGGLIGWIILDPITGAMWSLEDTVHADLSGQEAAGPGQVRIVSLDDVPLHMRPRMKRLASPR